MTGAQQATLKALAAGDWATDRELRAQGGNAASAHALERMGLVESRREGEPFEVWSCRLRRQLSDSG